ncbi:AfsR/SARP family transcriptional regulator [Streptomyces sp. NRRL WC-3742]|uniref:AfsR/SARP family transcriptional regulator n=1 Tax=Streptomyces sp. NRRL WC-3742 TaxID=1463934 RepID=UPI0004CA310D|nr:AfsR/SARP family transcriptional regulator [Streptomyces sp. NRRL WC-3742]
MEFRILGPVDVVDDGREVPLDGAKQRTVLAALLLAGGRLMPDDRLSSLLWGWEPPATWNAQLYTYVSRLRGRLGPQVTLTRKAPGYRLDLGANTPGANTRGADTPGANTADLHALDLHAFERAAEQGRAELTAGRHESAAALLRGALAHWRGAPLTGTTEHLTDRERPRLEELRLAALEHRLDADLELGRHDELVAELTSLVAEHPVRERLRGQLMTALHRCGRQADALGVYEHGRQLLAEELGVDPGPGLQGLHGAILREDLPGPAATLTATVHAPATLWTALRPAMLPADTPDFTGRTGQLAFLAARLGPSPEAPVTVVTGPAGSGKSALAVRAAQLAREDFPDGQLHADLHGREARPKSPAEVLGWFLHALGAGPREIPDGLDERAQLFRSRLAGRRMLLLLDDAADDRQVRPLLPGTGHCRTLVTSRDQLAALEAARPLLLGPLDFPDAYQLLSAVAGPDRVAADPASAARIVELCDRLPLALRIAAARLAAHPHWSPAALADRLTPEERRLDELRLGALDVRRSLHPSHHALDPAAREALHRLALAGPTAFTAREASEVLLVGVREAEAVLESLAEARLMTVGEEPFPRFRLSPLVRLFVNESTGVLEASSI